MHYTSFQKNTVAFHPARPRATLFLFLFSAVLTIHAQPYTKGVSIYPGDPKENFSPSFKIDSVHYRNLALYRPAYQSSAYDYNLTAQLITDGIIDTALPGWIVITTSSDGILKRDGREHVIDRHASSTQNLEGANAWLQVEMAGAYDIPYVDSLTLSGNLIIDTLLSPGHWELSISGSDDAVKWDELAKASADTLPGESALASLAKRFPISGSPAFNIRLKVVGDKSGKRILPVMYADNYFTLLPGEQKTVTMELQNADTRGEQPAVAIEGFNLEK